MVCLGFSNFQAERSIKKFQYRNYLYQYRPEYCKAVSNFRRLSSSKEGWLQLLSGTFHLSSSLVLEVETKTVKRFSITG